MKQVVLRAYQLARSGRYATVEEIRHSLAAEGFQRVSINEYVSGSALRADLTKLCEEAQA